MCRITVRFSTRLTQKILDISKRLWYNKNKRLRKRLSLPEFPAVTAEWSVSNMKNLLRILFLTVIVCSALISVSYATELYRTKYTPRYLKGNAC